MSFQDDCLELPEDDTPADIADSLALLRAHSRLGPRGRGVLLSVAEHMARVSLAYGDDVGSWDSRNGVLQLWNAG